MNRAMQRALAGLLFATTFATVGCPSRPEAVPRPDATMSLKPTGELHAEPAPMLAGAGWPTLFGPDANSTSAERGLALAWDPAGPPVVWRRSVGTGYSSPVVMGDRLLIQHRREDQELLDCLDAATGTPLWSVSCPTSFQCRYAYSSGPYSTPVIDGELVYTLSAEGRFACRQLADGQLRWERRLNDDFQIPEPLFGVGTCPLVEGQRLILSLGAVEEEAGIAAFCKQTGKTLWTATDHGASYATPEAATIHGKRFAFVVTFEGLVCLDPASGRVYDSYAFRSRKPDSVNATSPVVVGDRVCLVTGPGPGSVCLRVRADGTLEELWHQRRSLDSQFNTLIHHAGFVYGFSTRQQGGASFRAMALSTGKLQWKFPSDLERGTAIAADGHFILWGEHGHLASLAIDPAEPRLVAMTAEPLLTAPCYSAPALHRGLLYLRNEQTLLCLDLRRTD